MPFNPLALRHRARFICLILLLALYVTPVSFARHSLIERPLRPEPSSLPQQQQQTQRPAIPATKYIRSHDYDMRHILLNLNFNWEKEQLLGTATITFAPLVTNLRSIELDAGNMTFSSVKLASGAQLKYEADAPREKLIVNFDRTYQPTDVITIVIDYKTNGVTLDPTLANGFGGGLRWIKPTADDPTRPRQIWSQGETEYNHYWFPCYDHPNDFATSEMIATVEKPMMVISNGRLLETKNNRDNTRTYHWKMGQPHASYLVSIIVGEYAAVETSYQKIPIITYVYPNEVEEGKVTAARLGNMVKFFSEKTGVRYPYAKYAQTMTRDFGGGMENISATTMTDQMIHDARTELDSDQDGLQSHELAHQWFGDLVTCRTWADIWLNESFATYFQAMWDEHRLGRDAFLYLDIKGNQDAYYNAWNSNQRRPIVTKNYRDPDAVFDTYAYPRGGAVLHMLRKTLGDENWWRAINHYLRKYAHQPVSTEQFRVAIEEATGQSVDWFFDQWLYKMGHPVFRVTQDYNAATKTLTLTVKQEQEIDPNNAYPQVDFFRAPIEIEIGTNSQTRVEQALIQPVAEQKLTFQVDAEPMLVNFDYGNTLIKELIYDKPTDALVYQLTKDQDVMGRMWALAQLAKRAKDGATAETERQRIASALSGSLVSDQFYGMRVEAAAALSGVAGDAVRSGLLAATKDKDARVRARAIRSLAATKDPALASVYLQFLNDPSYATIRAAALALGETKNAAAYDALTKLVDTPSWRDNIRAAALNGLASLGDKRALDLGLRYIAPGNPPTVRAGAIALLGAVGKDDQRAFPLISEAINKAVDQGNFTIGSAAAEALVVLGDARGIQVFEQLRTKVGNPQIQAFLMQFEQRLRQKTSGATP